MSAAACAKAILDGLASMIGGALCVLGAVALNQEAATQNMVNRFMPIKDAFDEWVQGVTSDLS